MAKSPDISGLQLQLACNRLEQKRRNVFLLGASPLLPGNAQLPTKSLPLVTKAFRSVSVEVSQKLQHHQFLIMIIPL